MALWGFAGPSLQGLMTQRVDAGEQGRLQGAMSSLRGVTGLLGPLLFTQVFALAIDAASGGGLPGAPFLLAGALMVASAALAVSVTRAGST
jgi:DHA1 family tetracycline resistance protein-like MFS transporter